MAPEIESRSVLRGSGQMVGSLVEVLVAYTAFNIMLSWQTSEASVTLHLWSGAMVAAGKAGLLLTLLALVRRSRGWPVYLGAPTARDLRAGLLGGAVICTLFLLEAATRGGVTLPENTAVAVPRIASVDHIPAAIVFAICVAAWEELFFRGYTLHRLRGVGGGTGVANLMTALLFGVGHLYQGVGAAAVAAVAGYLLGALAVRRGGVAAPAIAHSAANAAALLAPLFLGA